MLTSFEEARSLVLAHCAPLGKELRSTVEALGRFLAEPLVAQDDSPRFDCSAVDGYGVSGEECGDPLRLVGRAEAGSPFAGKVGAGECVRILTGAVVPVGVAAIAMQENCRSEGDLVYIQGTVERGGNIRRRGEEYLAGATLMPRGSLVTPPVAGLATAQGHSLVKVGKAPRVAIVTTGNELRMPGEALGPGMVYASNALTLLGAVRALGLDADVAVTRDEPQDIATSITEAFESADLVLTTGGVSVGDRDRVRECALAVGVEELFWKVAMKPGKPVFFGVRNGKSMFGLPGNPVAATVAYHVFVRPAILRLMGAADVGTATFPVRLDRSLRKRRGRTEFVRACLQFDEGGVLAVPTAAQGSHMITGIATAEALLHLAEDREAYEEGEGCQASLLKWGVF